MPHHTAQLADLQPDQHEDQAQSVLSKANLLLMAFAQGKSVLGLTELSRRSGVSKASAHRLAQELVDLGYLARTAKGYQLGWRVFELGRLVPGPSNLLDIARPAMQDLRMTTRAIVHLSVPHGAECVYLDRIMGRGEIVVTNACADHVPYYSTSSGRIFLAYAEEQFIASADPETLSAMGAADHDDLAARLAVIRGQRYADETALMPGVRGIAVPVMYPGTERVIAALSVTVPAKRKDERHLLSALWATSTTISRGLGQPALPSSTTRQRRQMVG